MDSGFRPLKIAHLNTGVNYGRFSFAVPGYRPAVDLAAFRSDESHTAGGRPGARAALILVMPTTTPHRPAASSRLWVPKRVLITRSAAEQPYAAEIIRRCEAAGASNIDLLPGDRLTGLTAGSEREAYARAKSTLAVVVAPPSLREPQPIPPSADWRIDLARGCPAHCQYCYLAGSLTGPPITRAYANLDDVLSGLRSHAGQGTVTTGTAVRGHEGTTFELSCYTDPLGIEHLTGALGTAISRVGAAVYGPDVSLRFTTKFAALGELPELDHQRRTRVRFSVNAAAVARRFEGGTSPTPDRLAALRTLAMAGYPVGLTIAPVMPVPGYADEYGTLLDQVATALQDVPDLDLTAEIITHRFTPASRDVLLSWYPQTKLEMDESRRSQKRSKFGGVKYVYPRPVMTELRQWFESALAQRLPEATLLYWT